MRGGREEAGGGYGDAERYIRLVSERDLQPGYPLTGCDINSELQSGSNMRCLWRLARDDALFILRNKWSEVRRCGRPVPGRQATPRAARGRKPPEPSVTCNEEVAVNLCPRNSSVVFQDTASSW